MKKVPVWLAGFLLSFAATAQDFTQKQYAWYVETDLVYGSAVDYKNEVVDLDLDLYKPLNDGNSNRPLLVLVHGGSWIGGCKNDMRWLAEEMVARGYAVASINYRKGWHKDDWVPTPFPNYGCLYAADTCEIIRAMYRASQDAKAAVRWLKARALQDSTCSRTVLIGGESAGGFVSMAAAFWDREAEKPACCADLPDVTPPAANTPNCVEANCQLTEVVLPPGALARPDLGPVEGETNQNNYTSDLVGVINLFGGVPSMALPDNWIQGPDTPAVYLYHQTCDGVVPFGFGQPYVTISANCNLGSTPWHTNYPFIYGSGAIASYFGSLPDPPEFTTDFLDCPPFIVPVLDCFRYADNGSYHYTHNRVERAALIAAYFSPKVTAQLATLSCLVSAGETDAPTGIQVSPNPFSDVLTIHWPEGREAELALVLSDAAGRVIQHNTIQLAPGRNEWRPDTGLQAGWYNLQLRGQGVWNFRLIRL